MKATWTFIKEIFAEWSDDNASRLAAALAYYTLFSLAPLLVIAVAVAGLIFNQQDVQGQLQAQLSGLIGAESAQSILGWIQNTSSPNGSILASMIGVVVLLFGASGVFGQLQSALNFIWDVEEKPGRGILGIVKDRFLSFTMVLGIGFLLLVSLIISAGLSAIQTTFANLLPGFDFLWQVVNFVISMAVITVLFALMYKILPDVEVRWKSVWVGALVTALLFNIGKVLIGLYLGNAAFSSQYGAAGSVVILLLWIYYSAQILFFGAEFTQVYARHKGQLIRPSRDATWIAGEGPQAKKSAQKPPEPGVHRREAQPVLAGKGSAEFNSGPSAAEARKDAPKPQAMPIRQAPGVLTVLGLGLAAAAGWVIAIFQVMAPGVKSGLQGKRRGKRSR